MAICLQWRGGFEPRICRRRMSAKIEPRFCAEFVLVVVCTGAKPVKLPPRRQFRGVDSPSQHGKSQGTPDGCPLAFLVEARGIEPLSENHLIQLSPSAADLLGFPSRIAERQAMRYGSHYAVTEGVAPLCSRSPLIDAPLPVAVLRGRTGCIN